MLSEGDKEGTPEVEEEVVEGDDGEEEKGPGDEDEAADDVDDGAESKEFKLDNDGESDAAADDDDDDADDNVKNESGTLRCEEYFFAARMASAVDKQIPFLPPYASIKRNALLANARTVQTSTLSSAAGRIFIKFLKE